MTLTVGRLKAAVSYDPDNGHFTWKIGGAGRHPGAGNRAGGLKPSGYRFISIDGLRYREHRLAWMYMTGEWPKEQVDHRNGVRADNRWGNLREANFVQNGASSKGKGSSSGRKGVLWNKQCQKWQAKICPEGRQVHLGFFDEIEEAAAAYAAGAQKYFGEFARAA